MPVSIGAVMDDADGRYKNNYTFARKLNWLKYVYGQIRRQVEKYSSKDKVTSMLIDIYANFAFYNLPADCQPGDIVQLSVETGTNTGIFTDYENQELQEPSVNQSYSIYDGTMIQLHPTPNSDRTAYLYYYARPNMAGWSENTKNTDMIDMPDEWVELLVLGLLVRIAGARKDTEARNNYAGDFDVMLGEYLFEEFSGAMEYPTPRDMLPRAGGRWFANVPMEDI